MIINKKIKILFVIFFLFILFVILSIYFKKNISENFPSVTRYVKYLKEESLFSRVINDYNVKFLPNTQYVKLNLIKKKLNFKKNYYEKEINKNSLKYSPWGTFFIETHGSKIILADYIGNIYFLDNLESFLNNSNSINLNFIESNIKIDRVFDILIYDDSLFISYGIERNNCRKFFVSSGKINFKKIEFKTIFETPPDCDNYGAISKIKYLKHNGRDGILLSTAVNNDYLYMNAQNLNSPFGKTIFIDLESKKNFIFSSGHRVPQGLYVDDNLILLTEHGPKGGDEINRITYGKNYGWPIASYGEKYNFNYESNPYYKKNHKQYGFEEPIFYFIPSIAICEIKKLEEDFSDHLKNKFIISTLNGRSIFFVSFDETFSRLMSYEKVFLNQRIRDVEYLKKDKFILLAFEENGELGILKIK